MTLEEAYEVAEYMFKQDNENYAVIDTLEHPKYFIFFGGIPHVINYGARGIRMDKGSGEIVDFSLPRDIDIYDEAISVDIPDFDDDQEGIQEDIDEESK